MTDRIATLEIAVESAGAAKATTDLDELAASARVVEAATNKLVTRFRAGSISATQMSDALKGLKSAGKEASTEARVLSTSLERVKANSDETAASNQLLASTIREVSAAQKRSVTALGEMRQAMLTTRSTILAMTVALGGVLGLGKLAIDLQDAQNKIVNFGGVTRQELQSLIPAIRAVSDQFGLSQTDLTNATEYLTTVGLKGKQAIDALRVAAEMARLNMGDVQDLSAFIARAVNTYQALGLTATQVGDIIKVATAKGNASVSDFASGLSRAMSLAAHERVPFSDFISLFTLLTRQEGNAQRAGTQVLAVLRGFEGESAGARKALESLTGGALSFEDLRHALTRPGGLLQVLETLKEVSKGSSENLHSLTPNIRQLLGVLGALNNPKQAVQVFASMRQSSGDLEAAYNQAKGLGLAVDQPWQLLKNDLTDIGGILIETVLPVFNTLARELNNLVNIFKTFADAGKAALNDVVDYGENVINRLGRLSAAAGLGGFHVGQRFMDRFHPLSSHAGPIVPVATGPLPISGARGPQVDLSKTNAALDALIEKTRSLNQARSTGATVLESLTSYEHLYDEAVKRGLSADPQIVAGLESVYREVSKVNAQRKEAEKLAIEAAARERVYAVAMSKAGIDPHQNHALAAALQSQVSSLTHVMLAKQNLIDVNRQEKQSIEANIHAREAAVQVLIKQREKEQALLEQSNNFVNGIHNSARHTLASQTEADILSNPANFGISPLDFQNQLAAVANVAQFDLLDGAISKTTKDAAKFDHLTKHAMTQLSDGLTNAIIGTGSLASSFTSLLQSIERFAVQMLIVTPLLNDLRNILYPTSASGGPGNAPSLSGLYSLGTSAIDWLFQAQGGVWSHGHQIAFSRGGVVTRPTMFPMTHGAGLMGEAGPEAIMPLTRLPGGSLGVRADGGHGSNVHVEIINNTGAPVKQTEHKDPRGGRSVRVVIGEAMAHDLRHGGPLSRQISHTFGQSRVPIQR